MNRFLIPAVVLLLLSGCALQSVSAPTPRENAAMQLTREGRSLLAAGKPDNAIRLFERAIGLDPNYGECYYYLAEAWLAKGVLSEAREFNNLAVDYLKEDPAWTERLRSQQFRIGGQP